MQNMTHEVKLYRSTVGKHLLTKVIVWFRFTQSVYIGHKMDAYGSFLIWYQESRKRRNSEAK